MNFLQEAPVRSFYESGRELIRKNGPVYETADRRSVVIMGVRVKKAEVPQVSRKPENFQYTSTSLRILRDIAVAYNARVPILLSGDSGIGKTAALKKFAELVGAKLHLVNVNEDTTIRSLMTKPAPVGSGFDYVDGPITEALRAKPGEVHLIVLDEVNTMRSEVASGLHGILDAWAGGGHISTWKPLGNGTYEKLPVPTDRVYFSMTMNPMDEGYLGRKQIDNALARRSHLSQYGRADGRQMRELREIAAGGRVAVDEREMLFSRENPLTLSELMRDRDYAKLHNAYIRFHETLVQKISSRELGKAQVEGTYFGGIDMDRRVREFLLHFYTPENGSLTEVWRKALLYFYVQPFMNAQDRERVQEMILMFVKEDAPEPAQSEQKRQAEQAESYQGAPRLRIIAIEGEGTLEYIYTQTRKKKHAGEEELAAVSAILDRYNKSMDDMSGTTFSRKERRIIEQFKFDDKRFYFFKATKDGDVPFIYFYGNRFKLKTTAIDDRWRMDSSRLVLSA